MNQGTATTTAASTTANSDPAVHAAASGLAAGERQLLEMIALDRPLTDILNELCRQAETEAGDGICSVLLTSDDQTRLEHGAAPGLPETYGRMIHGRRIGREDGPCGMAAHLNEQVVAEDVATDSRWEVTVWQKTVLSLGLRACWSTPIPSSKGVVLGTFAIYSGCPGVPTARWQEIIRKFTHLASIALERAHALKRLQRSETYLAEAQKLSRTGSFSFRTLTNEVIFSEETCRIYEFPSSARITPEMARDRVHPEDVDLFRQMLFGQERDFSFECRLLLPGGKVKHLEVIARAMRDGEGRPTEWVGAVKDVTEHKHTAEALRASEHLARGQLEALASSLAAMSRVSAPEKFLEHVLRIAGEQLGATMGSVWELGEQRSHVHLVASFQDGVLHLPPHEITPPLRLGPKEAEHPVWTEFFRTGKYCVYGHIQDQPPWSQVAIHPNGPWHDWRADLVDNPIVSELNRQIAAMGIVATLNVPMRVADRVTGLFVLCFKQRRNYRPDELELTRAMANQAMLAIQLIRLSRANREAAVIAERNRVARDIHDTLAQGFTGVIMQLEAAADATAQQLGKEAEEHLRRARELARDSLQEARRSVRALRPMALEERSLADALRDLFRKMTHGTSLAADFRVEGPEHKLAVDLEENLLRIGQEVLTNALRHAHANMFTAALTFGTHDVRLQFSDNGRGFNPQDRHDGFGLTGIRERVESLGGQLCINSIPGNGTEITIIVPAT